MDQHIHHTFLVNSYGDYICFALRRSDKHAFCHGMTVLRHLHESSTGMPMPPCQPDCNYGKHTTITIIPQHYLAWEDSNLLWSQTV